jgi:putative ABC transport system permease protein
MPLFPRFASLTRNLLSRPRVERDLSDEVHSYIDLATDAKIKQGMSATDARRAALLEAGGIEQIKEEVREVRVGHFLETRWQDFRFAFRTLRKSPVFSLTVAVVLALGIGSTALMFTIVNRVLLVGPPFRDSNRIFMLWQTLPQEDHVAFSVKEFTAWQQQTQVFETLSSSTGTGFTINGHGEPMLVIGQLVTPSMFQTLGVPAARGRVFDETEGHVGHDREVILSHELWKSAFDGRAEIVGQTITMNSDAYTVVGIMPEAFDFPNRETRLWVPAALDGPIFQQHPDAHFLRVYGRLKPGVTRQRLQTEVDLLATRVDAADEQARRYHGGNVKDVATSDLRRPLLVLLCAVGFLLTIACANVANLMLARSNARQGEMAIRSALGASRPRLIAQLLTEAGVLAAIGGAFGLGIAVWGLDLLRQFGAQNVPELADAHLDRTAIAFLFAISAVSAVLFGLGPAFSASRTNLQSALKGTTRSTAGAGTDRTRHALVFAEVALAAVLLIGCGLLLRSFLSLAHVDPGFRPDNVVTANSALMKDHYPDGVSMIRFYRSALEKIQTLPGVQSVAVVTHLPFGGNDWGNSFDIEGQATPPGSEFTAQIRPSSPGYFAALGIPLRQGRDFSERDNETASGVAVVNEFLAKRFWPNESPLGKRIRYDRNWLTIVGVCGNIKHSRLDAASDPEIYAPYPQVSGDVMQFVGRDLNFVVRAANPGSVAADVRASLRALDPALVVRVHTMDALIQDSIAQPRFRTWLIGIFSIFALTLACLGIYGVIAYLVTQRYKEIGIRIALGATRGDILQLILGRTFKLAAAGIAAGLLAAFFLSRFLGSILFGITEHDPATFALVPITLIAIALLAGYLPARRAAKVNPVTSLRYE